MKHKITFHATIIINDEDIDSSIKIKGLDNYAHLLHLLCTLERTCNSIENTLARMLINDSIEIDSLREGELYKIAEEIKLASVF